MEILKILRQTLENMLYLLNDVINSLPYLVLFYCVLLCYIKL